MTKRNNPEEKAFNKQTRRKRVAFSAPKNAATKALIEQNRLTSPLLRLPLEIRNKIWSEVLGDRLVHLRYLYDGDGSFETNEQLHAGMDWSQELQRTYGSAWRHLVCEKDCPEAQEDKEVTTSQEEVFWVQSHHTCESDLGYETPAPDNIYKDWYYFDHEMMRLSVLRSCRQIYVEANNILWTSNTFSFADPTTFGRFMMTRTINQRRLIKSLRLQMEWVFNQDHQWNKYLNIALVRSLTALRRLRLNIEHKPLLFVSYESIKSENLLYVAAYIDGLKKLSTLPLTEVEIVVHNPRNEYEYHLWTRMEDNEWKKAEDYLWTKAERQDFAEGLRKILLNPKGAQIYAEDQLKWKEKCQRERENAAKIKASMFRPRLQSESKSMSDLSLARPSE